MNETSDIPTSLTKPLHPRRPARPRWSFFDYFWFVFKNVVGWILMLSSPILGAFVPGPGGIPAFLIGFALVSIPGKRKITSHVMRGRAVKVDPQLFTMLATIASIAVTAFVIWGLYTRYKDILEALNISFMPIFGICALAAAVTWLVMRLTVWLANWALRSMPRIRRFVRPWLRKRGINLLPPRRRQGVAGEIVEQAADEILQFSDSYRTRLQSLGSFGLAWLIRGVVLAITLLVVYFIFAPLLKRWNQLTAGHQIMLVLAVIAVTIIILLLLAVILKRRRARK